MSVLTAPVPAGMWMTHKAVRTKTEINTHNKSCISYSHSMLAAHAPTSPTCLETKSSRCEQGDVAPPVGHHKVAAEWLITHHWRTWWNLYRLFLLKWKQNDLSLTIFSHIEWYTKHTVKRGSMLPGLSGSYHREPMVHANKNNLAAVLYSVGGNEIVSAKILSHPCKDISKKQNKCYWSYFLDYVSAVIQVTPLLKNVFKKPQRLFFSCQSTNVLLALSFSPSGEQ